MNMEDTAELSNKPRAYIRDDDLGITDKLLKEYLEVFKETDSKINLECIPAKLETSTIKLLKTYLDTGLYEIHQHGVSHLEFEPWNEFPETRSEEAVESSLLVGKKKLEKEFGEHFKPFFTPPWHNIHPKFYNIIRKNFIAVSPFDLPIHMDMRIRDENGPRWKTLDELKKEYDNLKGIEEIGILLHHYLYNSKEDLETLRKFLLYIKQTRNILHFSDLYIETKVTI